MADPYVVAGAIEGGSQLVESLLNRMLNSKDRSRLKRFLARLEGQIGKKVFSDQELASFQNRIFGSRIGEINKTAEGLAGRLSLDSGVTRGALFDRSFQTRADIGTQLGLDAKKMQLSKDAQLRSLLTSGYSALA